MDKVKTKKVISSIPLEPGIYMMKDENDKIIYVGKAKSLKKRVRQYFNSSKKSERINSMISKIENIEYIVTSNELEALSLECNYIKEYRPKYNVMLKDDKSYPYIKITKNEKYPSIYITRQVKNDGSIYFGPYTDVSALREVFRSVKEIFPIKRCKYNLNKKTNSKVGPCLYYHIKRCLGPCINDDINEEYKKMIDQVVLFLEGKDNKVKEYIKLEIESCIEKLEFEKASTLKARLDNIEKLMEKQKVANLNELNADIIGFVYYMSNVYIQIFKIRDKKISKHANLYLTDVSENEVEKVLLEIIPRYYEKNKNDIPSKIYINIEDEHELKLVEQYISSVNNKKVEFICPKIGSKLKLIKMVENNININLDMGKKDPLDNLTKLLNINEKINSVEAFDISNLKDEYIVGASIAYEEGHLEKNKYRKYKIKNTTTQNDTASMYEIVSRRLKHEKDVELPDIFLIDGGKSQVEAAKNAIKDLDFDIKVIGMIKDDKHKTRGIIDLFGKEIDLRNDEKYKGAFNLVTMLQDEVHRFVITYHRSLRDRIKIKDRAKEKTKNKQ